MDAPNSLPRRPNLSLPLSVLSLSAVPIAGRTSFCFLEKIKIPLAGI